MALGRPPIADNLVRATARRIAETTIAPIAPELDRDHRFPHEVAKVLHEVGFLSLLVPEEQGGGGATMRDMAAISEELAYADVSSTMIFTLQSTCTSLLKLVEGPLATELYSRVVDGALLAIALTEPEAGSDASGIRTRARRDGDDWIIDGSKIYITNALQADIILTLVQTEEIGSRSGIQLAVVERDAPGLTVAASEAKMGLNGSSTCEVNYAGVRISSDRLVGAGGRTWSVLMRALENGRVAIGGVGVGIAQAALDRATAYAMQREQFGKPVSHFQGLQFLIADMAMRVESARAMVDVAAGSADAGDPDFPVRAAMAKCIATDAAMSVTTDAVQVFGGIGYMRETGVERLMRDAKILQIFEGTNQIMRSVVARGILKP